MWEMPGLRGDARELVEGASRHTSDVDRVFPAPLGFTLEPVAEGWTGDAKFFSKSFASVALEEPSANLFVDVVVHPYHLISQLGTLLATQIYFPIGNFATGNFPNWQFFFFRVNSLDIGAIGKENQQ